MLSRFEFHLVDASLHDGPSVFDSKQLGENMILSYYASNVATCFLLDSFGVTASLSEIAESVLRLKNVGIVAIINLKSIVSSIYSICGCFCIESFRNVCFQCLADDILASQIQHHLFSDPIKDLLDAAFTFVLGRTQNIVHRLGDQCQLELFDSSFHFSVEVTVLWRAVFDMAIVDSIQRGQLRALFASAVLYLLAQARFSARLSMTFEEIFHVSFSWYCRTTAP